MRLLRHIGEHVSLDYRKTKPAFSIMKTAISNNMVMINRCAVYDDLFSNALS